jgi:hypothetical protein
VSERERNTISSQLTTHNKKKKRRQATIHRPDFLLNKHSLPHSLTNYYYLLLLAHTPTLLYIFTHSHSLTHIHSLTYTHSHSLTHSLAHIHLHSLTHSLTHDAPLSPVLAAASTGSTGESPSSLAPHRHSLTAPSTE